MNVNCEQSKNKKLKYNLQELLERLMPELKLN